MSAYVLAIDQGTTSSRAIVFDAQLNVAGVGQQEFPQHFPRSGWVEHDPEDLWRTVLETCRFALSRAGIAPRDLAGIGITNQRETTLVWERSSGRPVHRAIVWQDRRTADACDRLKAAGHEPLISRKTGLLLDPYFSGTKVAAILDATPGARARADRGELAFGTVDSFLIWRLTGGVTHVTDATNASRSMLFDIHKGVWDEQLLSLFGVPKVILPRVTDSSGELGVTDPEVFGAAVPIRGVAGDQQAAMVGQACFEPGMMKSTYGTGCFALLNTGEEAVVSQNRLLTTIAYQFGGKRSKARSSSPVPPSSGCVMRSAFSRPLIRAARWLPKPILIKTLFSSPPLLVSAHHTGMPTFAELSLASRGRRAGRSLREPRWRACAIRQPISSRPCAVTGVPAPKRFCASTAAW
jgi:glycerol kinase